MSRIERLFAERRGRKRHVLVVYLCVGDPSVESSLRCARAALDGGADYIGFGPIFDTRSKANPDPVVGVGTLRAVSSLGRGAGVPVVAIGGIDLDTVAEVAGAGASAAAVISAVERAPDRTAAGRRVAEAFGSG